MSELGDDVVLLTNEVARIFRVNPRTVYRWANAGNLTYYLTPSKHYRYPAHAVSELLVAYGMTVQEADVAVRAVYPLELTQDGDR